MATVYTFEDTAGDAVMTTGVQYVSATTTNRALFNNPASTLTTTAYTTAIYYPADGGHETSGTGKIVFDNAYNNNIAAIVDNDDRAGWATVLLSATNSIASNAVIALTGVTTTVATTGAGYTSVPTVAVNTAGVGGVITPLVATAAMHSLGTGVTGINVTTRGLYIPGTSAPTVSFIGGGYTTQATPVATLSSGAATGQVILSLSATGYGEAQGPTERRLRLLGYI